MAFGMAALSRSKSGAYTARKGIPKDVQEEYARQRWEAKMTFAATLPWTEAARYGKWLAEIETRIDTIRARRNGSGQALSQRQIRALQTLPQDRSKHYELAHTVRTLLALNQDNAPCRRRAFFHAARTVQFPLANPAAEYRHHRAERDGDKHTKRALVGVSFVS